MPSKCHDGLVYGKIYSRRVQALGKTAGMRDRKPGQRDTDGSHWLVTRLLIGWSFKHELEERCDVRASNIEFARAAAGVHA